MRVRKFIATMIGVLAAVLLCCGLLTACGGDDGTHDGTHDGVEVVFELEGGEYKNSSRAVTYYYPLQEGASIHILTPTQFSNRDIVLVGSHIEGWYRTKNVAEDGTVTYADKWDFENDVITSASERIVLYACWKPNVIYSYQICYLDEQNQEQILYSYDDVFAGEKFTDRSNMADTRAGYTAERKLNEATGKYEIAFYQKDEKGELIPWDDNFTHPGGETDKAYQVFVKYIKGSYTYVSTADELISAVRSASRGIYLCNDIDMAGKDFTGFRNALGEYKFDFQGNNHTISNITLTHSTLRDDLIEDEDLGEGRYLLSVGLFGTLENSTIENITFTNVTVKIDMGYSSLNGVFFAPLAVKAKGTTVRNVHISGRVEIVALPSATVLDNIVQNKAFYYETEDAPNTFEGDNSFDFNLTDIRTQQSA